MTEKGSELFWMAMLPRAFLQEFFVLEITTAQIQCETCGSTGAVGLRASMELQWAQF